MPSNKKVPYYFNNRKEGKLSVHGNVEFVYVAADGTRLYSSTLNDSTLIFISFAWAQVINIETVLR